MSGSERRGEGIRQALAGEQPVRRLRVVEPPAPVLPGVRRRDPRLLLAAVICGVIALVCLALVVWR